jgi:hypothetical protein
MPISIMRSCAVALLIALASHSMALATDAPAETVRLKPIAPLSLAIPKGWVTCKPEENALLGGLPDTVEGCKGNEPDEFVAYNPVESAFVFMNIYVETEKFAQELVQDRKPGDRVTTTFCEDLAKALGSQLTLAGECKSEVSTVAGRPSVVMRFEVGSPDAPDENLEAEVYVIPSQSGDAVITFISSRTGGSVTRPLIESLLASIQLHEGN